ncbi:MAG: hypothetical protein EOO06_02030 [Chitinophagaceae bacterium]|nr:MAG: hypothetical protein EOO06_02030 [Chitinophagaceae bacterium]
MKRILFVLCCCLVCFLAGAQPTDQFNFKFKKYSTAEGLSDITVLKTVTDKYGFLWVATHNGISRFDGLNFKTYTHQPKDSLGLRSIWVSDLILDKEQTLWASTEWGLCYFDETQDRFIYINHPKELQLVFKMPLFCDSKGWLWIAAEDGLKKINTATKSIVATSLTRIADPQFIIAKNNDQLLLGTRGNGLFFYNIPGDHYQKIHLPNLPADIHLMDGLQDANGSWIASSEGLLLLDDNQQISIFNQSATPLPKGSVKELMSLSKFTAAFDNNKIICGTYNKKLFLFDIASKAFTHQWESKANTPDGFEPSIVYSLQADKHILWIGTNKGLDKVDLENQAQQTYFIPSLLTENNNSLVKKVVLNRDGRYAWLICWQPYNGLILYDKQQRNIIREWCTVRKGPVKKYSDILRATISGDVYVSRENAVDIYQERKGLLKTIAIPGTPICLEEDKEGNVWVGLEDGLAFINIKKNTVEKFSGSFSGSALENDAYGGNFPVSDIKLAADNKIWLTNSKFGLFNFDPVTKRFVPHRQPSGAAFSTLNRASSLEIINDTIWVASMSGLSYYLPASKTYKNFDVSNGFASTYVYSIVSDGNHNLWGRGNADVFAFNTHSKKTVGSKLNQQYDVFFYYQRLTAEGTDILLGHEAGFSIFNSSVFLKPATALPGIFISRFLVQNQPINFDRKTIASTALQLRHDQNQVSFELNAIEFNHPEEIEYSYKLEGIENEWIHAGNKRNISYNFLRPGNYRFCTYASNRRNKTQSLTSYFTFRIEPAWWQHWWFWPLLAAGFIAVVLLIAYWRINNVVRREEQKTAVHKMMAELENKMLRSQMNPHFIFNSLNSIQKYIWENKEEDAAEYLSSFAKLMRAILENSRRDLIPLREEIKVMKLYIALEHRRSNAGFDFSIEADDQLQDEALIPPLIMQPFIENAIWHGLNKKDTKGKLLVKVFRESQQLVCIINDDGVGLENNPVQNTTEHKSLGIAITKQRLDKIMETTGLIAGLSVVNKSQISGQTGTIVTISLPLQTTT